MKINGITNSMNFGLAKTKEYRNYEKSLIQQAQAIGKERQGRYLSDKIGQKVPTGLLDIDTNLDAFVLTDTKNNKTSSYVIKKANSSNPIKILFDLNRKLGYYQSYNNYKKLQEYMYSNKIMPNIEINSNNNIAVLQEDIKKLGTSKFDEEGKEKIDINKYYNNDINKQ